MTNEEIDAQIAQDEAVRQAQVAEARRIAAESAGYSVPPPNMSSANTPAPPPQSPSLGDSFKKGMSDQGSLMKKALPAVKDAAILGGSALVGGPVGYGAAKSYITARDLPPSAPNTEQYGPPKPEAGPPEAPASADDSPLILPTQGAGKMVMPAGMYPSSETTQVHQGRDVPLEAKRAFNASTDYAVRGAEKQAEAERGYGAAIFNQTATRLRATEDAMAEHQRVQAERDHMVRQKLAEIESFNAQANAEIDPNKFWHDRGALAMGLGAIAIGLGEAAKAYGVQGNAALSIIENGINREVETQWKNRQLAGHRADRAQNVLSMHLDRLKDQDKAIDATKAALWDNITAQVDAAAAQKGIDMADANLLNIKAGIAEKRGELLNKIGLQEADDINKQATSTWHNPVYAGGGAGKGPPSMEGWEMIPVPASDQTSEKNKLIAVPKDTHAKLAGIVGATNTIIGINNEALERIKEIEADKKIALGSGASVAERTAATQRIVANRKVLTDLAQKKSSYISSSEGQGVLKEEEFKRAMDDRTHFNDYWTMGSTVQKRIQAQNNSLAGSAGRMVQGAGGQEVKMAYSVDQSGYRKPTPIFTGKVYTPPPVSPELAPVKDPKKK